MTISIHAQKQFDDYELFAKTMDSIFLKHPDITCCLYGRSKMEEFAKKYFTESDIVHYNPDFSHLAIQNLYKIVEQSDLSIFFFNDSFTGGYMATSKTISRAKNLGKDFLVIDYLANTTEEYYDVVREELQTFIEKYQKNPFNFLTEHDLQSYLYSKIFDSFENKGISVEIETTGENEPIKRWKQDEKLTINTNPVKTEYPADYTFDIAVIDNEDVTRKASAYWHQKLKTAIELKFHRCAFHRIPAEINKFKKDIEKLKRYQIEHKSENFRGLSIIFIQNDNEKREKEFKDSVFKENYKIADLNQIIRNKGVSGIVVTGSSCFELIVNE